MQQCLTLKQDWRMHSAAEAWFSPLRFCVTRTDTDKSKTEADWAELSVNSRRNGSRQDVERSVSLTALQQPADLKRPAAQHHTRRQTLAESEQDGSG